MKSNLVGSIPMYLIILLLYTSLYIAAFDQKKVNQDLVSVVGDDLLDNFMPCNRNLKYLLNSAEKKRLEEEAKAKENLKMFPNLSLTRQTTEDTMDSETQTVRDETMMIDDDVSVSDDDEMIQHKNEMKKHEEERKKLVEEMEKFKEERKKHAEIMMIHDEKKNKHDEDMKKLLGKMEDINKNEYLNQDKCNSTSRLLNSETSSQYKGVIWNKERKKWCASMGVKEQTTKFGGYFQDHEAEREWLSEAELDAAKMVNQLCEEFGISPQNLEGTDDEAATKIQEVYKEDRQRKIIKDERYLDEAQKILAAKNEKHEKEDLEQPRFFMPMELDEDDGNMSLSMNENEIQNTTSTQQPMPMICRFKEGKNPNACLIDLYPNLLHSILLYCTIEERGALRAIPKLEIPKPIASLSDIGSDLRHCILTYCNIEDMLKLRATCTSFQEIIQRNDDFEVNYDYSSNGIQYENPFGVQKTKVKWIDLKYFMKYSPDVLQLDSKNFFKTERCQHAVFEDAQGETQYVTWPNDSIHNRKWEVTKKRKRVTKNSNFLAFDPSLSKAQFHCVGVRPPESEHAKMIVANKGVSIALMPDGSLLSWHLLPGINQLIQMLMNEEDLYGLNIPEKVKGNAKILFSTASAFAAVSRRGKVMGWGDRRAGANIPEELQLGLRGKVKMIFSTYASFTALLDDYTLIQWGEGFANHNNHPIPQALQGNTSITKIKSNKDAFVALTKGGDAFTWGFGKSAVIPSEIQKRMWGNVKSIEQTDFAFTALLKDGTAVSWGKFCTSPTIELKNVKKIVSTDNDFLALFENGKVVSWGKHNIGDTFEPIYGSASNIFSTRRRFAARLPQIPQFPDNTEDAIVIWNQFGIDHGEERTRKIKGTEFHGVFSDEFGFTVLYGSVDNLKEKYFRDPEYLDVFDFDD